MILQDLILNIMNILRKCDDFPKYEIEINKNIHSVTSSLKDSERRFQLMYVMFSHNLHSVASSLKDSEMWLQLMYIRFSHNWHSVTSLLRMSEMWIQFTYIRFFLTWRSEYLITWKSSTKVLAYVRNAFLHRWNLQFVFFHQG